MMYPDEERKTTINLYKNNKPVLWLPPGTSYCKQQFTEERLLEAWLLISAGGSTVLGNLMTG